MLGPLLERRMLLYLLCVVAVVVCHRRFLSLSLAVFIVRCRCCRLCPCRQLMSSNTYCSKFATNSTRSDGNVNDGAAMAVAEAEAVQQWWWRRSNGGEWRRWVLLLLPATAEGGGCAVIVGAGVMVGVLPAMAERGGGCVSLQKKQREEVQYHNTVQCIILSYVISK